MNATVERGVSRKTALLLAAAFMACAAGCGSKPEQSTYQPVGKVSLKVQLGADTHGVTSIHFKVVGVEESCDGPGIAETVSPIESEALPTGQLPEGSGPQHAFADGFFVLAPGTYHACATPLSARGEPSQSCGRAEAIASVMASVTTEVVLVSQCQGDPTGGLDVIGTLNDPPKITGLTIRESKFITTCEQATFAATAIDPNGDTVSFGWTVVAGPAPASLVAMGPTAVFKASVPGDYSVMVTVIDNLGGATSLTFPVHVSGADCDTQASGVTLCDEAWGAAVMPPDATNPNAICGVPGDPLTSYWYDFDSGQKVKPGDPQADLSKGHVDCCSWNLHNGALQVDTGVPAADVATVSCNPMDGRVYAPDPIVYSQPFSSVICLRTSAGAFVKYTARASCCGGITIDWSL